MKPSNESTRTSTRDALGNKGAFALVLDTSPTVWTSVDEFHYRLCRALRSRGVRTVIIYAVPPPPDYHQRIENSGAAIASLNYAQGRYPYFRGLGKIFREHGVEIVQTRGFNYFSLLWWMVRLQGVRKIVFLEGNSGLLRARSWKKALLRLRAFFLTLPILQVVTVTNFVKRQLVELGIPERKIEAIYNGVDLARFCPNPSVRLQWRQEYRLAPEDIVISTISYLRSFKNPHVILEACGRLAERGLPVRLFVAGTGELLEPMKQLSRNLGIDDRVYWLGNYGRAEKLLQASDVFVLSSVGEAIGNVLLEAMACGVPCVATDSGGIPEVIEDGKTGLLAPPLDSGAFADRIQQIIETPGLMRQMAEQSVARAKSHFDVDGAVQHFLQLYASLYQH